MFTKVHWYEGSEKGMETTCELVTISYNRASVPAKVGKLLRGTDATEQYKTSVVF